MSDKSAITHRSPILMYFPPCAMKRTLAEEIVLLPTVISLPLPHISINPPTIQFFPMEILLLLP